MVWTVAEVQPALHKDMDTECSKGSGYRAPFAGISWLFTAQGKGVNNTRWTSLPSIEVRISLPEFGEL